MQIVCAIILSHICKYLFYRLSLVFDKDFITIAYDHAYFGYNIRGIKN